MFKKLEKSIQGDLHEDLLTRYMLSTDGSIFRVEPRAVAYPKNTGDVRNIVAFAKTHGFSVHPRGAGSGLCGSSLGRGVVIDFTRYMNRLISIDPEQKYFECEPGYRLGELEATLKGTGLFFPPDPSSGEYATFGGMYGTNASGAHSVKYGNVADYILDAEVTLGTGSTITLSRIMSTGFKDLPENLKRLYQLYETHAETIEASYPDTPCNTAGYNLRKLITDGRLDLRYLFAGAEGTLGVVTKLKFRLIDKPLYDSLVVAYMPDIVSSGRAVQQILSTGPSGIEIMDQSLLNLATAEDPDLKDSIPDGIDNVLLIEFDSFDPATCAGMAEQTLAVLKEKFTTRAYLAVSAGEKARFWAVRKAAVPILYKLKGRKKILALIEDAAVPIRNLTRYFQGVAGLLNRHGVQFVIYGHIAKGLLHTRPLMDLKDPHDIALLRTIADEFYTLIHKLDGTVSGEHGDGRIRSAYVRRRYPGLYERFLETKHLLDPENLMNPEIITHHDPDQMKKKLRFGESYQDRDETRPLLSWPLAFSREIEKCHGCSKCTTVTVETRMCPVYKITRQEKASPKAKANILRALVSGRIDSRALYETKFQQVIDQCIHCGSCFLECPSHVNIPKMAVEARARYIRKYGPSLHDRIIVNAELAGRTTRRLSPLLKSLAALAPVRTISGRIAGVSADRDVITFSAKSLREQIPFRSGHGSKTALYFAGCYASYIQPSIGIAAVKILNRLDMTVVTPDQHCCGLPMLSKGMLPAARGKVRKNLVNWAPLVGDAAAVVVTCSSCGLSLMQEWEDLLGDGAAAQIKQKVIHISRLIVENQQNLHFKPADLNIAYHAPCHLKVQKDPESSVRMLRGIPGVFVDALETNCCGMAGSWGMSATHFRLSKQIGQDMIDKLDASNANVGVTDCPTCRMQMEQFSSKPIRHPVEIVAGLLK